MYAAARHGSLDIKMIEFGASVNCPCVKNVVSTMAYKLAIVNLVL